MGTNARHHPPPPPPTRCGQAAGECAAGICALCVCWPLMLLWHCIDMDMELDAVGLLTLLRHALRQAPTRRRLAGAASSSAPLHPSLTWNSTPPAISCGGRPPSRIHKICLIYIRPPSMVHLHWLALWVLPTESLLDNGKSPSIGGPKDGNGFHPLHCNSLPTLDCTALFSAPRHGPRPGPLARASRSSLGEPA
ncbi:hypothetical protein BHM03_00020991 [Ensete ventricosum]|uniref:Uncharacterized protein n=1 Tax=Ensete ventricosum TaxID=4639 RepID=A0A445MFX8_ENSVE|nr:hypothetical protein BHM03_00020991 [Ensete ventricosum]